MDLSTMREACAATEPIVDAVRPDHLALATPCAEWDVRVLLNHLLGTLALGAALLGDTEPPVATGPGGLPAEDLVTGTDLGPAYRAGVDTLLAAAAGDALHRTHATPFGELPGVAVAGFTTLDIAVHGWDLATAIGHKPVLGDELAEPLLELAHATLAGDMRGGRIGPEVAVPAGASTTDRLVGFLGRTP